jgi:hypothetical protein
VPLLQAELAKSGWHASGRTIRRVLHRLGWVWKRPRFALAQQAIAWLARLSPFEHLRCSGLLSLKFQGLST